MLMQVGPIATFGELGRCVSIAFQYPFSGQKSFNTNGTTSMYPACANANFSA
jgi:hypothetical protein